MLFYLAVLSYIFTIFSLAGISLGVNFTHGMCQLPRQRLPRFYYLNFDLFGLDNGGRKIGDKTQKWKIY